ncbi:MAG: RrF2 family transcriptional regulator [Candidatus Glassbacteria bacterium]
MLLSRACEYALLAVWYLAREPQMPYIPIKEIAKKNRISSYFLGKVLQKLTQKGILISYKGSKGGVALARPAEEIKIAEVVEVIDGLEFRQKCITGLPRCNDKKPCPLHQDWTRIREEIYQMLASKSIAQLVKEGTKR